MVCKALTTISDGVLQQEAGAARQQLIQAATALEAHMAGRTYIAGQQLSLADLVLAAELKPAFEQVRIMLPAAIMMTVSSSLAGVPVDALITAGCSVSRP